MKRSELFIKRKIGTQYVIVAVGEATKQFNGMISVNSTGSFIWDCLAEEISMDELVAKIVAQYEVDDKTATNHVGEFVATLQGVGAVV